MKCKNPRKNKKEKSVCNNDIDKEENETDPNVEIGPIRDYKNG